MKNVLGRGLSSLLDDDNGYVSVNIKLIDPNPFQPRKNFIDESLNSLADSIREKGIIQPILVREKEDRFEIIAGERRFRAAKIAGLEEVPVVVKSLSDKDSLEIAIIENIQREELNPIEESEGYMRLTKDFGHTQEDIAKFTGKSRSYIANSIRLLSLPEFSKKMLADGKITVGHAKIALSSKDPDAFVNKIINDNLTVRQSEVVASKLKPVKSRVNRSNSNSSNNEELQLIEEKISTILDANVKINLSGNTGSITIDFVDLLHLDTILQKLTKSSV